jgi:hypothetical protein
VRSNSSRPTNYATTFTMQARRSAHTGTTKVQVGDGEHNGVWVCGGREGNYSFVSRAGHSDLVRTGGEGGAPLTCTIRRVLCARGRRGGPVAHHRRTGGCGLGGGHEGAVPGTSWLGALGQKLLGAGWLWKGQRGTQGRGEHEAHRAQEAHHGLHTAQKKEVQGGKDDTYRILMREEEGAREWRQGRGLVGG